jgi:hypothetical protein
MELCPSGPLYLELGNGIQSVLERLSQKSTSRATCSIDSVVLRGRYCRFIDTHVSPDEIRDVLRMASCLPNLKRLSLLRLRVPVTAITPCLPQILSLQSLELRSICLSGSPKELQALAHALVQNSSITKISLADCRPPGSCDRLDALVRALGDMPSLQHVELDMMELSRWLSSVQSFCHFLTKASQLKTLSLSYMRLPHDYVLTLTEALTSPTSSLLQELYLDRCDSLSPQSAWAMAQMLRNNSSLKQLHIVVKHYEDAIPMAQALEHNTSLVKLLLRTYHYPRVVRPAVYQAFRQMLERNCSLLYLEMFQGHPMRPWLELSDPTLQIFLKVNRAGRAKLMQANCTNEQWVATIIASKDDVDCSFYFLSQNPTVCQINTTTTTTSTTDGDQANSGSRSSKLR